MNDSRSGADDSAEESPPSKEEQKPTTEDLRREVEERYDFENFGPAEMDQISAEEWDAAFDPDTWITGPELLDRVEADLRTRVLQRDVFARVERHDEPDRIVAYSDEGYAVVYPDGSVEGEGTVLRDVKPSIALCSMDDYDAPEMPDEELLPKPMDVPDGSGEFGNLMLQVVAGAQVLAGLALLGATLVTDLSVIAGVAGLGFLFVGLLLLFTVANARLSDKFRAEEYRNRLRAVGVDGGEPPAFLPKTAREEDPVERDDNDDDSTPRAG